MGHTIFQAISMPVCTGSSPHTWGILAMSAAVALPARFIPTYVGHTGSKNIWQEQLTVHPHIRGAYRSSLGGDGMANWFIPTYVGHTTRLVPMWKWQSVHPHIRGAYKNLRCRRYYRRGSSPHTWGILSPPPQHIADDRFIPTYVGHTFSHRAI